MKKYLRTICSMRFRACCNRLLLPAAVVWAGSAAAQTDTLPATAPADSLTHVLEEVPVQAYEQHSNGQHAAMPVAVLSADIVDDYAPQSAVQAVNTVPGVHMEERSPSSYRLNIRGSSMRAPFGVRNVKIYYDGLPFTDAGGTSYLNQLGPLDMAGAEIVKGPAGSMYGAGTGGLVLLRSPETEQTGFKAGYTFGSYHTHAFFAAANWRGQNTTQQVVYQQSFSNGYRDQSASRRGILSWHGAYKLSENMRANTTLLLGDLYYETPGGLTLQEYNAHPEAARPSAGGFPSAQEAAASIKQQMIWAGISLTTHIATGLDNTTGVYIAYTGLRNAAIRNYADSKLPNGGLRTVFNWQRNLASLRLKLDAGMEWQSGASAVVVSGNNKGKPGMLQSDEQVRTGQGFVFLQGALGYKGWELVAGASLNRSRLTYTRLQPVASGKLYRRSGNIIVPRITLSRALPAHLFAYLAVSKGFSPPVTDELLPSGSSWNATLEPEEGWNYEAGLRYNPLTHLFLEAGLYYFRLDQTIVQRRDAAGGDYYVNAGNTRQPGLELAAKYKGGRSSGLAYRLQAAYAYQPYQYGDFEKGSENYSGNALPGLSRHNLYAGVYLVMQDRFLLQSGYYYNSAVPLNDANTATGDAVHLLSGKAGVQFPVKKAMLKCYAGADNLLNGQYSMGYDINAAAGRYYNAAPLRNFYIQVIFSK